MGSSSLSTVGPRTAQSEQDAYISVVKTVGPSVVEIATDSGLGSGVVFDNQGNIVTNSHGVGNAEQVEVTTADGKRFEGVVVYSYPPDDLAVVRVTQARLKPATFADSSKVQVGEIVLAIGNPLGLQSSVTEGIVSATGRVVSEGPNITLPDTIQTSAAINPGNSGGALVNLKSEVIGIPTLAAISPANIGGQAPGIGFAISSNRVKSIASQIVRDGRVTNSERAYLGIQAADTTSGGVLVKAVEPGGPAAKAGIEPGELITAVAGDATPSRSRLSQVLATLQPNQAVPVNVRAGNGEMRTVNVMLGEYPGS
jgi:putative serine protease PepD